MTPRNKGIPLIIKSCHKNILSMEFDRVSEFRFDAAEDARIVLVTSKPRPSFRSFEIRRNIVFKQREIDGSKYRSSSPKEEADPSGCFWALYVDGSSNMSGTGAGLILISPEGVVMEYTLRFEFSVTNNGVE